MVSTNRKKQIKPKVPKGYTDEYTTYELITKTTYSKPYKMPKPTKASKNRAKKQKEYAMPVKIVSDTSGRKQNKSSRKSKRG